MCRLPFDKPSCITLLVDLDLSDGAETNEALRLHQAIANIADEGVTERRLRQLIQECKTFLNGKPRHMVRGDFLALLLFLNGYDSTKSLELLIE